MSNKGDIILNLCRAAKTNDIEYIRGLIHMGFDINNIIEQSQRYLFNNPLHIAVSNSNIDVVRLLLAHGIDVNGQLVYNELGPLHCALDRDMKIDIFLVSSIRGRLIDDYDGMVNMVCLLMEYGADPGIVDSLGRDAFDVAGEYGLDRLIGIMDGLMVPVKGVN